jgi:hypothetical protein
MADRPTFSDPLPEGALPADPGPQPNLPVPALTEAESAAQDLELTGEQRATLAQALFIPTVKRMVILMTHVVRMTQNGDLVLWLSLSALDAMLRDLKWEAVVPGAGEKFLGVCIRALHVYTDRLEAHQQAWATWERGGRQGPAPVLVPFDDADAARIYADVDAEFSSADRPINRTVVRDMLLMVIDETDLPGSGLDLHTSTKDEILAADKALMNLINGWTDEECRDAQTWAANLHLRASDHDDLPPLERPRFIGAAKKAT